jgi:ATP-dependent DNA helicase
MIACDACLIFAHLHVLFCCGALLSGRLGKTIQVLLFLAHLRSHRVFGPFLIVAPLGTLAGWQSECARWTPSVPMLLYHGTKAERRQLQTTMLSGGASSQPDASFPVVLTSFEIAMNDAAFLKRIHWKLLAVDEGHRLKNLECQLLQRLQSFPSENRLLLTGTPLQNSLLELWSLLHFLLPDIFSSLSQFQSWFDFDGASLAQQQGQEALIDAERDHLLVTKLHTILRPFVLRRVKADVLTKLPAKTEFVIYTPLSQLQRMYYSVILEGELSSLTPHSSTNNALMQLRKTCNHPYLLVSDEEERAQGRDMLALALRKEEAAATGADSQKPLRGASDDDEEELRVLHLIRRGGAAASGDKTKLRTEEEEMMRAVEKGKQGTTRSAAPAVANDDGDDDAASETVASRNKRRKTLHGSTGANQERNHTFAAASSASAAAAAARSSSSPFPPERLVSVCGKLQFLDQLLPALRSRGNRVLIFSQMTRVLDVLEDYLELRGMGNSETETNYCRIDGSTKSDDRARQIAAYNAPSSSIFVFLLSTRAGGLGINLASADTVVIFDSDFNPTVDAQAADRAHRLTQQKPVLVFRLLSPGTVEMAMHARANSKKTLEQLVLTKGRFHTGMALREHVLGTSSGTGSGSTTAVGSGSGTGGNSNSKTSATHDAVAMEDAEGATETSEEERKNNGGADAGAASAAAAAASAPSVRDLGAVDWRRQTSIVHELVELFRGTRTGGSSGSTNISASGARMGFAGASPAAAAAAKRAAAAQQQQQQASASPPPAPRRNNSLKRKSSARDAAAAASSSSSTAAPMMFDPLLLDRLLDRSCAPPPDMPPPTPLQAGFERVHASQRSAIDRLTDAHAEEVVL